MIQARVKRELAKAVRQARLAAGMTQAELARRADLAPATVGDVEQARRLGSVATLLAITHALQVCPGVMLLGVYENAKEPA